MSGVPQTLTNRTCLAFCKNSLLGTPLVLDLLYIKFHHIYNFNMTSYKVFTPYRGLGLVSNDIPLVVRYIKRREENLIVTVVGAAFHTYGDRKLNLLSVGNPHTHLITCLAADTYHVYTACNKIIYAWRRGTELKHTYCKHLSDVKILMPFGPHLISVEENNVLCVWDIKSEELYLQMDFSESFKISCILHPATYLNKILLGSKQGKMQLWNIKTNKLEHTLEGWNSEVLILAQAPAIDVIAVGLSNGEIYIHNLKVDETIMKFKQDWGPVTSLCFRTDGAPIMMSGSELGHIALWNLENRRLSSQICDAHKAPVTGMACLPNEPLMVTSSADNTLKMWIFDMPDGGARLHKIREGHSKPPLKARFHGSQGDSIITAGEDSTMRVFSTVTDRLNKNLGQASYNRKAAKRKSVLYDKRKMPPIISFTSETTQEKPWDNIVAIHRGEAVVTTWSLKEQKMGDHKFLHERFTTAILKNSIATAMEMTVCGNFVLIGYDSGHIDKYNIQSGIYRGSFGDPLAHNDSIGGIVADGLNQLVISGCLDGSVKWWKYKTMKEVSSKRFDAGISILHLQRDSGLLAIALEDWSLFIIDIDTKAIVRRLFGHDDQITDVTFSPNSKWLVSASLDRTIRMWDIPSSSCVDMFKVPVPASSITMSPTGDFLASIHAGHLGVYLWANRTCYQHVSLYPLAEDYNPVCVPLPSTGADSSQLPLKEGDEETLQEEEMEFDDEEYVSPEQISKELITLALQPTSRWLNLLNIDTIKRRNKPSEPPKAPKAAPFFIPTVPGLEIKFADPLENDGSKITQSKISIVKSFENLSEFGKILKDKLYEEGMNNLFLLGPSAIDIEIRSLDPDIGGSEEVMHNFLRMIKYSLNSKKHFEVAQGYLGLFMKVHSEFLISNIEAQELCQKIYNSHKMAWHPVKDCLNESLSLISYFKNAALINY